MLVVVAGALLAPGLGVAAPAVRACPPLGALPGFEAQPARLRTYETVDFRQKMKDSDELETVSVSGRSCTIEYQLQAGRDPMSELEISMNYQQQYAALGAELMSTGIRGTAGRLVKGGAETWFNVEPGESSYTVHVVQKQAPAYTMLPPGPNDYRLLGHMPHQTGTKPVIRNFDQMTFPVMEGETEKTAAVQGRTIAITYGPADDQAPTQEEVLFNYREALARLGAEVLFQSAIKTTARLVSNGQVVWIYTDTQDGNVDLRVVEEKPFEPTIKPAQDTMRAALDKAGRVALYVNFDFGKATLRPDAAPVVAQVVALLKADPALKLSIEGHTDNLGAGALNQALSRDRAAALVAALTAQGVAAGRLSSAGYGAEKPVASNETSDGRARNRRVELVKM